MNFQPVDDAPPRGSSRDDSDAAAVLDSTSSLLVVTEIGTGRIVTMNRAAEELTGFRRDQVIGVPLWEIAAPAHQAMLRRALEDPRGKNLPDTFESTVNLRGGLPRRIVWSSTFVTDPNGARTRIVLTGIDISSEAASGGLFAHLMRAANSTALVSTDRRGRVTYCSAAAERMLGVRGDDLIGKPLPLGVLDPCELMSRAAELQVPADLSVLTHRELDEPTLATSGELLQQRDWTLTRADGTRLIAAIAVSAARDARGMHVGYVGVAHDVTERRRAQQTLTDALAREEKAVERLHELDRTKSEFVATVSHELRTPTTSIVGCTELLQDGLAGELAPAQLALVDTIGRNSERLITLADDLVTLARVDAGDFEMESCEIDLQEVVSRARDALQPLLLERLLEASVELPGRPVVVVGDATHLLRAVGNLLSNAIKFTDDGGRICCRVTADDHDAVIVVSDSGVGIPKPEQRDLFTRFFRSSTAHDRASQGSGLGLSIVAAIVHHHGGEISVDSEHLQGCTFVVRIPLAGTSSRRGAA